FKESRLFDPGGAGHFAVTIFRKPSGEDGIVHVVSTARKNCGDAGAYGAFANPEFSFAVDERGVADENSRDIGDHVVRPGRTVKRDAEIARPRLRFFLGVCRK